MEVRAKGVLLGSGGACLYQAGIRWLPGDRSRRALMSQINPGGDVKLLPVIVFVKEKQERRL